MPEPIKVEREYVRAGIVFSVKAALRRWLGKGHPEPLAERVADEVLAGFDRARWEVNRPNVPAHSTSSGLRPGGPAPDGG